MHNTNWFSAFYWAFQVIVVFLKLMGVIDWPWTIVLAPAIFFAALLILTFLVLVILWLVKELK